MDAALQQSIKKIKESGKYSEKINILLDLIIDGKLSPISRDEVLAARKIARVSDLKEESVSVVIDYAKLCLEDGVLSDSEIDDMRMLKLFFKIGDGDFYKCKKQEEVKEILTVELQKLYADKVIDKNEALMKVDLQVMFGLSYDEFYEIVNEVAGKALKEGAKLEDLDTVFVGKKK